MKLADLKTYLNAKKGGFGGIEIEAMPQSIRTIIRSNSLNVLRPSNCPANLLKQVYIGKLTELEPEFKLDKYCEPIVNSIINYLRGTELSSKKGLLLMGGVGTGKTLIMRGLIQLLSMFSVACEHYFPSFQEVQSYAITAGFAKDGFLIFDEGLYIPNHGGAINLTTNKVFIDDLGVESKTSYYGDTCNVIAELLLRRYDKGDKTFATTNLDGKSLKAFYGDRVYSRMKEMFNTLVLGGIDRRE